MAVGFTLLGAHAYKRINSTSTNFNWDGALKFENVLLKAGTDIIDPVFLIQKTTVNTLPMNYNYIHCVELNRYYWIKDIIQEAGQSHSSAYFMELHCHVDVLGSWKSYIKDTPCYVKYCSDFAWKDGDNKVVNLAMDDERLSADMSAGCTNNKLLGDDVGGYYTHSNTSQAYSLTLGQLGPGATSSRVYIMSKSTFDDLYDSIIFSTEYETQVTDSNTFFKWMADKLGGVLLDPASFIQDIRVLPYNIANTKLYPNLDYVIKVGKVSLKNRGSSDTYLKGRWYSSHTEFIHNEYDIELNIPGLGSPSSSKDIAFLRRKKYLQVVLVTPFGNLNLSTDNLTNCKVDSEHQTAKIQLHIKMINEVTSGDIGIQVFEKNSGELLGKISGNLSLNMTHMIQPGGYAQNAVAGQIKNATTIFNAASGVASAVGAGVGMAIGGPIGAGVGAGAIRTASHLIGDLGNNVAKAVQTVTSDGGTIVANANTWADMELQISTTTSQGSSHKTTHDWDKLFNIQCIAFTPTVCSNLTMYENYAAIYGYPCFKVVSSLEGLSTKGPNYIECAKFDVRLSKKAQGSNAMLPQEADEINSFMNTGVYWEPGDPAKKDDVA